MLGIKFPGRSVYSLSKRNITDLQNEDYQKLIITIF